MRKVNYSFIHVYCILKTSLLVIVRFWQAQEYKSLQLDSRQGDLTGGNAERPVTTGTEKSPIIRIAAWSMSDLRSNRGAQCELQDHFKSIETFSSQPLNKASMFTPDQMQIKSSLISETLSRIKIILISETLSCIKINVCVSAV